MFNRKLRLSRSSMIVIVMCVIVLLAIFFLSYLNLKHVSTIQNSLDELSKEDTGVVLLRKCSDELVKAENHYRIFINSSDGNHRKTFLAEIDSVISDCNRLNDMDTSLSKKIQQGIGDKLVIYDAIKRLKLLADSVSNAPSEKFTIVTINEPIKLNLMERSFFKSYFSSTTDTIKLSADRKKTGFFKKLGNLFSNKEDVQLKRELIKGSASEKNYIDSIQHSTDSTINSMSSQVRNFYQKSVNKELSIRQQLNAKETSLAQNNLSMIAEIDSSINELLSRKEADHQLKKEESLARAASAKASIGHITFYSFLSILVLIGLLVYNIYRTNKYEEAIIAAKTSAEKLATLKSRFLSNMSHEIRSPLTAIMGFTEQVAHDQTNGQDKKYLDAIKVSSDHLLNTVNDILDFSKLDAGKLVLNKKPFNLKKAIDEVAFAFSLESGKKGIGINVNTDFDERMTINGDVHRFKQILYNLVSNAVKFTDQGEILISASSKKVNEKSILATIAVKDSGIGINPSQFDMIFQEFAQATSGNHNEHVRAIKGTGLGLPITKMLTELQNGKISVESMPGKGSVFTVKIPYDIASPATVPTVDAEKALTTNNISSNNGNKNILVVEDNELNVMLISVLLQRMHCQFDIANDGEKALDLYQQKKYNLILTDINVPKLTGVQLAERIRKDSDTQKSKTKIVALTAAIINDDFDNYIKSGINKILTKPFKEDEFRKVVEEYLN